MAVCFGCSFGLAYALVAFKRRGAEALPDPRDTLVKLRTVDGVYRANVVRASANEWIISSPIQRDRYVPLRVGDSLTVEWPTQRGIVMFRSKVVARDAVDHTFGIEAPAGEKPLERRSGIRSQEFPIDRLSFDGLPAELVDIGERGCRLRCRSAYLPGTRVRLDLPWHNGPVFAAVLESREACFDGKAGAEIRVVFEDRVQQASGR